MPTRRIIAKHGWRPQLPDQRDFQFTAPATKLAKVSLGSSMPITVEDQGQLGSCTANAIAVAIWFDFIKQKLTAFRPSRLFIYYNERAVEGSVSYDSGAMIRDGIKSINTLGVCNETLWPYSDANPGPFTRKPPKAAYTQALKNKSLKYQAVAQNLTAMKACLASGSPFVFGFSVYASFESDQVAATGVVPMPGPKEQLLGGHAVLCYGYDDATQRFLCRNSWGSSWGQGGNFTIPYAYLTNPNLASDFWVIQVMA